MEIDFKGKRALVTGAGQGIGKRIAEKLAECGATIIALDVNKELLDTLKSIIPSIECIEVDLCDWTNASKLIEEHFPIDLVVNSAGIATIGPLTSITEEQTDKTTIKGMVARKAPGAIVNLSSQASKAALLDHCLYCATKGAVDAFTRAVALEYGPHQIRINTVNPTVVMTALGRKVWSDPEVGKPMLAKIPLKRFAEVDDVADTVLFLLSDKAAMITGSCLAVDGGFLAC